MPREASPAFLMWARGAQTGDWDHVLKAPLTGHSFVALWMLSECPTYANFEARRQSRLLSAMLKKAG